METPYYRDPILYVHKYYIYIKIYTYTRDPMVSWTEKKKKEGAQKTSGKTRGRGCPYILISFVETHRGFPAWLLADEKLRLRTYERTYIAAVSAWWSTLLIRLRPHLYEHGGPIIGLSQVHLIGFGVSFLQSQISIDCPSFLGLFCYVPWKRDQ